VDEPDGETGGPRLYVKGGSQIFDGHCSFRLNSQRCETKIAFFSAIACQIAKLLFGEIETLKCTAE